MDFTEVLNTLKTASLFELYRLRAALKIGMEDPEKIQALRQCFAVNDQIAYFNDKKNALCQAVVVEKNVKYVVVKDLEDHKMWNAPYYALNLTGQDSHIHAHKAEKLTKNHFRIGELVGFMHEGKQLVGHIEKLNPKSVSLITQDNKRWRVGYGWLFKVLEGELGQVANVNLFENGKLLIEINAEVEKIMESI